ncbi:MAG: PKD domain-containing protein [Reichenbachiella sp.]|uniref:PKD domain-containing protein n=1 Tax=Reichenbachiella sp. TaxID=2184521 RepID=UPI0032981AA3
MKNLLKNSLYLMVFLMGALLVSCGDDEEDTTPPVDPPIAGFTLEKNEENNLIVTFTNTSIGGETYSWDFGDDSDLVTTKDATYTFTASGTYTVTLTVTNEGGTDEQSQDITVSGFGPNLVNGGDMTDEEAWTLSTLWGGDDNVMNHGFSDDTFVFLSGADAETGDPYQYSNYSFSQEIALEAGGTYHFSADVSSATGTNATWFEVYFLKVAPDTEDVIVDMQVGIKAYGEGEDCTKDEFSGDIMTIAAACTSVNAFDQLLSAEGVFTPSAEDLSEDGTIFLVFKVGSGWAPEGEIAGFGDGLILDNVVIKEAI